MEKENVRIVIDGYDDLNIQLEEMWNIELLTYNLLEKEL